MTTDERTHFAVCGKVDAHMYEVYEVGGDIGGECHLIVADGGKVALVDTGFAYCAQATYARIREVLGDRPVDYLLLTHSHYDHASAGGYLKAQMPSMQVVAAPRVARVFQRPGALATMRELNDSQAHLMGLTEYGDVSALEVGRVVEDGDIVDLGTMQLQVLDAPGHTRDSLAFWCESEGLLVTVETMGVYGGPQPAVMPAFPDETPAPDAAGITLRVSPAYLVSTHTSLDFIRRATALNPHTLIIPHSNELLRGNQATEYLKSALYWADYLRQAILKAHAEGWDEQRIFAWCKQLLYCDNVLRIQPEKAFDLNLSITIPMVIAEYRNADSCHDGVVDKKS